MQGSLKTVPGAGEGTAHGTVCSGAFGGVRGQELENVQRGKGQAPQVRTGVVQAHRLVGAPQP
jgi:hypothetical protein